MADTHNLHPIDILNDWFQNHCNGEWEHGFGIDIETLDNPGWALKVYLLDTELQDAPFEEVEQGLSPDEDIWWICKKEENFFKAYCSSGELNTVVGIFNDWSAKYKLKSDE